MAADSEKSEASEKRSGKSPIIIDLGKRSRRQINRLRRGKGELLDEVHDCLDELAENGKITKTAQPVIVVVTDRVAPPMGGSLMSAAGAAMPLGAPLFVVPWGEGDDDDDVDEDEE
jgi:uncharacterized protein DUF6200